VSVVRGLRKTISVIDSVSNKELDSTRAPHVYYGKFRSGRFECISDGFAEPERPIKGTRKSHARFVSDWSGGADRVINYFRNRARLFLCKTGVQQNQSHVVVVESKNIFESPWMQRLSAAIGSLKEDSVTLASVSAEMNDLWFIRQKQPL
jgi:hypothetical protein